MLPLPNDRKLIILVVDDTALIVKRLTEMLSELKNIQTILTAGSFSEAIAVLNETQPDIALLDIHLPDKSGLELLRTIKSEYPDITVAMLTNQSTGNYKLMSNRLGADYFIDKSKDFLQIPDIVSNYKPIK